jgi:hypothetical protein
VPLRPARLSTRLFSFRLTESHTGAAAVSIDEVDTRVLESASDDL